MFWDGRIFETADGQFLSPAGARLPYGLNNVVAVQAMFPVTSRDEMRGQIGDVDVFGTANELARLSDSDLLSIWSGIMERLLEIPEYQRLFAAAYPDITIERLRFQHAANAIADYEMSTFTHADSQWDRYLSGDDNALSAEEMRGAQLFFSEARCAECHNGSLLTDQKYHNIGVPQLGPGKGDEAPEDYGRGRETNLTKDRYAYRTPPLRNVTITGPWMHNGAYTTLEDAVRHHLDPASALANYDITQIDPLLRDTVQSQSSLLRTLDPLMTSPVELTSQQFDELMAFLRALTSPSAAGSCDLIPDSVPSGLPVDVDPNSSC
jgi:cytochrome c peroxidase